MKKTMKISILLFVIVMLLALSTAAFASQPDLGWESIKINASTTTNLATRTSTVMGQALGVVQMVGMGVAVIMLIVLAIKYISAAPGDKAEIKKHAVVYIIGAVVLFGAAGLLEIIKKFADQTLN